MDMNAILGAHMAASNAKVQMAALGQLHSSEAGRSNRAATETLTRGVIDAQAQYARQAAAIVRGGVDMLV
ncbi:MAG: hypothetical protein MUF14_02365 [Hyphomonadaceae bacterium]|jgi:hypothetical protein|nr:hypothetical protein [Hyphomonadaceae bacterium]